MGGNLCRNCSYCGEDTREAGSISRKSQSKLKGPNKLKQAYTSLNEPDKANQASTSELITPSTEGGNPNNNGPQLPPTGEDALRLSFGIKGGNRPPRPPSISTSKDKEFGTDSYLANHQPKSTTCKPVQFMNKVSKPVRDCWSTLGEFIVPPQYLLETPKSDETGPWKYRDESTYKGQHSYGMRHGKGTMVLPDGSQYQGTWKFDNFDGYGRLVYFDGDSYEGEFKDGKLQGRGTYLTKEGYKYQGEWMDDLKHGQGTEIDAQGIIYLGAFVKGMRSGQGKLQFPNGQSYEGEFLENYLEGHGVFKWPDGRSYTGDFKRNEMDGYGEFHWPNDDKVYKGGYKHDKKHGYGELVWKDGSFYKGDFKDGLQEGEGVHQDKHGNLTEGTWRAGNLLIERKSKDSVLMGTV